MSGIYTGAMGMISNLQALNTHAQNIANSSTDGYKFDEVSFRVFDETNARRKYQDENTRIGAYNDEVYTDDIYTHYDQGDVKVTSNPLDMMIQDQSTSPYTSFFTVSQNGQELFTRNGNFTLNAQRQLATYNGAYVLGENGQPITIPQGVNFSVKEDGTIENADTGETINKIQLHSIGKDDLQLLEKKQGGFYQVLTPEKIQRTFGSADKMLAQYDSNPTLQGIFTKERLQDIQQTGQVRIVGNFQGAVKDYALETSNVKLQDELVGLMKAQKGVQSSQKVTMTMDKVLEKEANDVGK